MINRLASESSPYLQQHAGNPVDWHPWGEEALELARETDRPILLSIGYSSCHWCHVMERESFEDPETASLMNELFVSVKVDREERPDIDQVYMKAVQAMTGGGGWPLTAWLTPDGVPFYGGTYYPPEPRHGMPSFRQVLRATAEAWRDRRGDVVEAGRQLVDAIRRASDPSAGGPGDAVERAEAAAEAEELGATDGAPGAELLDEAYRVLEARFDERHGGFGGAPKFPQPVTLEIVLRRHARTGEARALEMLVRTLERMAAGGLRDHLAGGFHRYSVDAKWLVPHFEKMLYDNALLARMYLDAFRVTGDAALRAVAEQTLDYLLADMRSPEGGFFSARDADSEGEEGLFYVWTPEDVESVLGAERAAPFMRVYGVTHGGNFEGRSILHLDAPVGSVARALDVPADELEERLAEDRIRLLEARARREEPFRDEKILAAWNGLAVRALAEAGATLDRPDYVDAAVEAAGLLMDRMRPDGRLLRVLMHGEARIPAFLEDHAALGNALLSLHGATLDLRWLEDARWACDEILDRFLDPESGALFDVASDAEALVLRARDPLDNATPSGTSLAAELLVRAGHVFDDARYRDAAERIFAAEEALLRRFGPGFGRLLAALDRARATPVEVAIVGDPEDAATRALVRAAHARFLPNLTIVGRAPDAAAPDVPLLEGRGLVDGRPAAYVCRGYACRLPVTRPEEVVAEIEELGRGLEELGRG